MSSGDSFDRAVDAAFAIAKPCKHGTVLADFCGLCKAEKSNPDAIVRYAIHHNENNLTGSVIQTPRGFGAFLRDDDAEMFVDYTTFYPTFDAAKNAVDGFFTWGDVSTLQAPC